MRLSQWHTNTSAKEATDWRDRQMHAQRKGRRGDLIPVIVAAFFAVVGQTVILFDDFGPGNDSQGSGSARMMTAAVVSRPVIRLR